MADQALRGYVDRVANLIGERQNLNNDIKEIYEEAKEAGFVTKHLRTMVREFLMDRNVRQEQYEILDQYRHAIGLLDGTPLGEAAMRRAAEVAGGTRPKRRRGRPAKKMPQFEANIEDFAEDHAGLH